MKRTDYGYYIAMLGVAIIIIWAILKSIGVIQSPTYIEMIPIFGAAVTLGSLIASVNNVKEDVGELKGEIKGLRDNVIHLDKDAELIKSKMHTH